MKKFLFKLNNVLVLTLLVTGVTAVSYAPAYAASPNVWWPTSGSQVSGTQPFKAVVDGMQLSDYSMYWQVDNGQLNQMSDNYTDAPHKEASVDLSSWHWQTSGAYQVNFVAKDKNGNTIGNQTVTIHANQPASAAPTASVVVAPSAPANSGSTGNSAGGNSSPASPAPVSRNISIWWPVDGAMVKGVQPFKALVDALPLSSYTLYWQVDGGQLNQMNDNHDGGDHKETSVDLTNWNWNKSGPYAVTFTAKDPFGNTIASKTVNIRIDTGSAASAPSNPSTTQNQSNSAPSTPVVAATSTAPVIQPPVVTQAPVQAVSSVSTGSSRSGDPLSGISLYVDPNSDAALQAKTWTTSDPTGAADMMKIASEPVGTWFGGWNANIQSDAKAYVDAAAAQNAVPVLIAYNIPFRDCGGYSAGGATTADAYNAWIAGMAAGIGSRRASVILEPDALAGITCLSQSDQSARYVMLQNAVATLKANKNTSVYIDAGNSNWTSATDMAPRLKNAGIALADGFALNVSNFYATQDLVNFGDSLSPLVGNKHFVIDTSRNGLGPLGSEWCNPSGRALGEKPTAQTGNPLVDAFLWLKTPGESDGNCNGGPSAGVWWPDYAVGLAERAKY